MLARFARELGEPPGPPRRPPQVRSADGRFAPPTLGSLHDGLRRPRPLSRAVREPLPPRLPGEVQGVGPRDPVVAAEPARAARRLPARLRAPVAGQRDPALPALPARRPGVLDLLLDVAPDRGALDDRQRRADQEGALPAPAGGVLRRRDAARDVRGDARRAGRALARLRAGGAVDGVARDPARRALRLLRRRAV